AMHDARLVCRREAIGHLSGDLQDSTGRKGCIPDFVSERASVDQLRDDVQSVVLECRVEDGDDIGMVERARRARLRHEALSATGITTRPARQHLQRDLALEARIPGAIHHAATALADERKNAVRPELLSHAWRCCAHEFWSLPQTASFMVQR